MGKAVVTTSTGAEGIEVTHRRNALIADTGEDFAACVVELLQDNRLRKQLGENGRRMVEEKYSAEVIAQQMESDYEEVISSHLSKQARGRQHE